MANPDTLRYTKIPLNNGSGAIPAVGFGTLIPDPVATKDATLTALEVGFRHSTCESRGCVHQPDTFTCDDVRNEPGRRQLDTVRNGTVTLDGYYATPERYRNEDAIGGASISQARVQGAPLRP